MKLKVGSKKAFVFVFIIGVILGVMAGIVMINNRNAVADKNYIDSQKQKLEVENKVQSGNVQNDNELEKDDDKIDTEEILKEDGIKVVPTVLDGIVGNAAYCPTFQIVWNELADKYVDGKEVVFLNDKVKMADNLNEKTFTKEDISEEYYYVKVGKQILSVKKEIEDSIKDKFNETSEILDMVEWVDDTKLESTDDINSFVFYTMLKRNFEFNKPFDILDENGIFKNYMNVKYFGINDKSDSALRRQVDVLFYNNESDFAAKLKTKDNDEVIVLRVDDDKYTNFEDVYSYLEKQTKDYDGEKKFTADDYLKVPNLKFNVVKKYEELKNKPFLDKDNNTQVISEAIQTIEFELDNKGGKLKSEALIAVKNAAFIEEEPVTKRYFHLTNDFYVFLKEEGKDKPYFALKVEDIKDFQDEAQLLDNN